MIPQSTTLHQNHVLKPESTTRQQYDVSAQESLTVKQNNVLTSEFTTPHQNYAQSTNKMEQLPVNDTVNDITTQNYDSTPEFTTDALTKESTTFPTKL